MQEQQTGGVIELVHQCACCGAEGANDDLSARALGLMPPFGIKKCPGCRLRWQSPRPTASDLTALYSESYFSENPDLPRLLERYVAPRTRSRRFADAPSENAARVAASHLQEMERRLGSPGNLLEVGVGRGTFLQEARSRGWQCTGIEPSAQGSERARAKGLDVVTTTLESFRPEGTFDAVFAGHVLEHLRDPLAAASLMRKWLRPGGILVIEVPNQFDSPIAQATNALRFLLRQTRPSSLYSIHHLYFFGPSQLAALLSEAGFRVEVGTFGAAAPESAATAGLAQRLRVQADNLAGRLGANGPLILAIGERLADANSAE